MENLGKENPILLQSKMVGIRTVPNAEMSKVRTEFIMWLFRTLSLTTNVTSIHSINKSFGTTALISTNENHTL